MSPSTGPKPASAPGQAEPDPAPGGILSKYRTSDASQPAIEWSGGTFTMSELSRLETAPADTGLDSVSANLRANYPDKIIDQGAADTIPDIDVEAKVTAGLSSPALTGGGSTLIGDQILAEPRSVAGNLTVNGDLIFAQKRVDTPDGPVMAADGTLYVDGDLTLNGGIKGIGSLYVSGDITVRGGNASLQTSQPTGTAMMAGGDVSLEGLDAAGYLQSLAAADPNISDALDHLNARLGLYASASEPGGLYETSRWLSKHAHSLPQATETVFINPLPGPDGRHNLGYSSGALPRMALAIKATGIHLSDPRAAKVINALEEMDLHFRDNDISFPALSNAGTELFSINDDYSATDVGAGLVLDRASAAALLLTPMDDLNLEPRYRTHTSLNFAYSGADKAALSQARRDAYLLYNPLDWSWLENRPSRASSMPAAISPPTQNSKSSARSSRSKTSPSATGRPWSSMRSTAHCSASNFPSEFFTSKSYETIPSPSPRPHVAGGSTGHRVVLPGP
jgi:hypothetical protein